jgi:hypothetical protein
MHISPLYYSFAGILMDKSADPKETMAQRRSGVLLVARILISGLFLFVGVTELKRQLAPATHDDGHGHKHAHQRPAGDGHDEVGFNFRK